jgi:hypothetical protein
MRAACAALGDPGSRCDIEGAAANLWLPSGAISSVGRAPRSHRGGREIETPIAHPISPGQRPYRSTGPVARSRQVHRISVTSRDAPPRNGCVGTSRPQTSRRDAVLSGRRSTFGAAAKRQRRWLGRRWASKSASEGTPAQTRKLVIVRWVDRAPRSHTSHDTWVSLRPVGCLAVISEWVAAHLGAWHNRDHDNGLAAEREGPILRIRRPRRPRTRAHRRHTQRSTRCRVDQPRRPRQPRRDPRAAWRP